MLCCVVLCCVVLCCVVLCCVVLCCVVLCCVVLCCVVLCCVVLCCVVLCCVVCCVVLCCVVLCCVVWCGVVLCCVVLCSVRLGCVALVLDGVGWVRFGLVGWGCLALHCVALDWVGVNCVMLGCVGLPLPVTCCAGNEVLQVSLRSVMLLTAGSSCNLIPVALALIGGRRRLCDTVSRCCVLFLGAANAECPCCPGRRTQAVSTRQHFEDDGSFSLMLVLNPQGALQGTLSPWLCNLSKVRTGMCGRAMWSVVYWRVMWFVVHGLR